MKLKLPTMTDMLGFSLKSPAIREEPRPLPPVLEEKNILLSWESLSRPHQADLSENKLSRTFTVIAVVVGFILIVLQMYFLLFAVGSVLFVNYVLSKVPPEKIAYTISTHGVSIDNKIYYWAELSDFFFKDSEASHVLVISTLGSTLPRIYLTYQAKDRDRIKELLLGHLVFLESEPKSVVDKTYESLIGKLNIK